MNNLVIAKHNVCPSVKQYKMEPLERKADAHVIKVLPPKPAISPNESFVHYRVVELKENGIAGICSNMSKFEGGKRVCQEVNLSSLGPNGVHVGDVIGYKQSDVSLSKPFITHRASQKHQHPGHLVAPEERA